MNKEQLHKEFDEEMEKMFRDRFLTDTKRFTWGGEKEFIKHIEAFYDSKIQGILKELVGGEAVRGENDFEQIRNVGYNVKRTEIIEKIKELGYE